MCKICLVSLFDVIGNMSEHSLFDVRDETSMVTVHVRVEHNHSQQDAYDNMLEPLRSLFLRANNILGKVFFRCDNMHAAVVLDSHDEWNISTLK